MMDSPRRTEFALVIAIVVGMLWTIVQFAVSEITHQISYHGDENVAFLGDFSELITWPAGVIYERAEIREYQNLLAEVAGRSDLSDEQITRARRLLPLIAEDFEAHEEETWDFLDDLGLYAEVPLREEYLIYGGVCLAWGAGVGITVFVILMLVPALKPPGPAAKSA